MKNEKIYEGLKVKGIRILCEILGEKYDQKHGDINKKLVGQYCNFHYEGKFVIVDEVFETPRFYKKLSYDFKYNVGDVLFPNYGVLLVNEQKRIRLKNGLTARGHNVTCQICGYNFDILECNLDQLGGCSVCSHHKVLKGYNDIWTTNPEIAQLLLNSEDGYKYSIKSNKKLDWKCLDCGTIIRNKRPYEVWTNGLVCRACGDGVSYPNKIMFNILTQLNEDFDIEVKFKWCIFPKYNSDKNTYGLYDFVLENRKLIIEMDGGLNHQGGTTYTNCNVSPEEYIYKDYMKDKLATEHGYKVIRIDCKYFDIKDRHKKCKDGIIESMLSDIFDLSNIDWDNAHVYALKSKIIEVCDLYNQGMSISEIYNKVKLSKTTIHSYLHQGNVVNLCKYET